MDDRHALLMQGLSDGLPQKAIAQKLSVNQSTVSRMLSKILPITNSRTVHHAIKQWHRQGWIQ
jgi:DNA-binding NarL/FixJ family response regulator